MPPLDRHSIRLVYGGSALLEARAPFDAQTELLDGWILWQRARGLSSKTIDERVSVIRRIPDAEHITAVRVDRFLTNPGWAKSTRATYHGAIRAWCRWLIASGRRTDDPTVLASTPKVPKGRPRPLADEHVQAMLNSRLYKRTRVMVLLGAYSGLRVSEIAAVRGDDIDLITNSISVVGKGGKLRVVPLHPLLRTAAATMAPRGWWFPSWNGNRNYKAGGPMLGNSVSACLSKTMQRVGVPGTPHALRHWFGSALRAAGVDSLVIKELMGHESIATTAIYVDVPLKQRRAAVELLPAFSPNLPLPKPEVPIEAADQEQLLLF